jgi:hypothetical protein
VAIVDAMGKADVLERVAIDLSRGHTAPAIQRLSSLVHRHPTDLDLRRRLAEVHRMVGNWVEAGRWSYLLADADPAETLAFERAYPSPIHRLAALRWPGASAYAGSVAAHAAHAGTVATQAATHAATVALERLQSLAAAARRDAVSVGRATARAGRATAAAGQYTASELLVTVFGWKRPALIATLVAFGTLVVAFVLIGAISVGHWVL